MKKNIRILLISVIVLTDCLPQSTKSASEILSPTRPISSSANTALPTSSPGIEMKCITASPTPPNLKIEGTVLFLGDLGQSIILQGENDIQIPQVFKGNNGNSEQSVSPDGTLLMYRKINNETTQPSIIVATSDGHIMHDFPDTNEWLSGITWLSNEYIRYPMKSAEANDTLNMHVLNAQTGKLLKLRTDFPDIGEAENGVPDWGIDSWALYFGLKKGANIVYDPFLTRAAYPKTAPSQPFYATSLYDVQNDKELALANLEYSFNPKWSPDGEYFSIIGTDTTTQHQDIFIVARDGGQFVPLTNLSNLYPKVHFVSYSWSPNSQQIAFWVNINNSSTEENSSSLMIFDFETMKTTDLCIKGFGSDHPFGIESSVNFDLHGKPIWSPDGKKLVTTQYDEDTQKIVDILIDLENKITYPIAIDLEPAGWMK